MKSVFDETCNIENTNFIEVEYQLALSIYNMNACIINLAHLNASRIAFTLI